MGCNLEVGRLGMSDLAAKRVRIGGAAGAWGDSSMATAQLLSTGALDYIIYEALAEVTMAILSRARRQEASKGYAIDFIDPILRRHLAEIQRQKIKVVTNAGGMNPRAAASTLAAIVEEQGLDLKIVVVEGDDLMGILPELRKANVREMETGMPLPETVLAINAYLGAFPVAAALAEGADVVITGRVVDSALVLAPLIHEFGWQVDELDKLAQGSLAGHLLECGPQSTGGLLTDWQTVESWVNIGYPIAEVSADGNFVLTKPAGSDGLVNIATVTEQILYEIGNPRAYILPDVTCDFADVELEEVADNQVRVTGAKGYSPPDMYKACALEMDGYRLISLLLVTGRDAAAKAQRVGETLLARMRQQFSRLGWPDFRATSLEMLGAEHQFGPHSQGHASREVILKIAAHHDNREALTFFAREIPSSALSMAQSLIGGGLALPRPTPLIRVHSFLIPRKFIDITVDGESYRAEPIVHGTVVQAKIRQMVGDPLEKSDLTSAALLEVAYGRSGDKGDICNIGIVARKVGYVPFLRQHLTEAKVKQYLGHLIKGRVERFELPGLNAFNFVCYEALGGGGTASLRFDPLGKGLAQMLLEMPLDMPAEWLE